jgi:hypothetical protein
MAKVLSNGLLKGRLGNIIYYVKDGIQYARIYSQPTDLKSDSQLRHRAKVRDIGLFFKQFKQVLKIGYQSYETPLKIFNQVVKYHLENAIEETTPTGKHKFQYRVVPEKVRLATGVINAPEILTCKRNGQDIDLTWKSNLGPVPNLDTDALAVVAFNEGLSVYDDFHVGKRHQGSSKLQLPGQYTDPVHLWAFYWNGEKQANASENKVSESIYLGIF